MSMSTNTVTMPMMGIPTNTNPNTNNASPICISCLLDVSALAPKAETRTGAEPLTGAKAHGVAAALGACYLP